MGLYDRLIEEKNNLPKDHEAIKVGKGQTPQRYNGEDLQSYMARVKTASDPKPKDLTEIGYEEMRHVTALVDCPTCKAKKTPTDYAGYCLSPHGAKHYSDVHYDRLRAFLTCHGITKEQFDIMPYRRWPNADNYTMWGVFPYKSDGQYAKKVLWTFTTYEEAHEASRARNDYINTPEGRKDKKAKLTTVEPMVFHDKEWIRYDLVPNKPSS